MPSSSSVPPSQGTLPRKTPLLNRPVLRDQSGQQSEYPGSYLSRHSSAWLMDRDFLDAADRAFRVPALAEGPPAQLKPSGGARGADFDGKTRLGRVPTGPSDNCRYGSAPAAERVVALTLTDPPGEMTHWTADLMAWLSGINASAVRRSVAATAADIGALCRPAGSGPFADSRFVGTRGSYLPLAVSPGSV